MTKIKAQYDMDFSATGLSSIEKRVGVLTKQIDLMASYLVKFKESLQHQISMNVPFKEMQSTVSAITLANQKQKEQVALNEKLKGILATRRQETEKQNTALEKQGQIIAIIGNRVADEKKSREAIARILDKQKPSRVVTGDAGGPDTWGAEEARKRGIPVDVLKPKIREFRKDLADGFDARNKKVVDSVTKVYAIMSQESTSFGAGSAIVYAKSTGKIVESIDATREAHKKVTDATDKQLVKARLLAKAYAGLGTTGGRGPRAPKPLKGQMARVAEFDAPVAPEVYDGIIARVKEYEESLSRVAKAKERIANIAQKIKEKLSTWQSPLKKLDAALKKVSKGMRRVARSVRAWGRNFLWLGRDVTIFTAMAVGAAVKATMAWAQFEEQMVVIQRVLARRWARGGGKKFGAEDAEPGGDIEAVSAEAALRGTKGIMAGLITVADDMAISISAATASFGHLVRAGYDVDKAISVSNQAMILNRGSLISLADATQMMISVQRHWKDIGYEAVQIADIMTVADENAAASLSSLSAGMGFVMGTASRMGMSLEGATAAMTLLTNAGFSGSVAGRELRSVMNNLMQNAELYGIAIMGADEEMLSFDTILQNVEDELDSLDNELERTMFLQELFGETNVSLVQTLMANRGELEQLTEAYKDSGDAARLAAEKQKLTLEYQLDQVRVAVEKVILAFGKGFGEALQSGDNFVLQLAGSIKFMIPAIEHFANSFGTGFIDSIKVWISIAQEAIDFGLKFADALGAMAKEAEPATVGAEKMSDKVGFLGENIGMVAGFALVAGPAMIAVGVALEILSPILFTVSFLVSALSGAISILSLVVSAFGFIVGIATSIGLAPFVLIVIAVVAAILILIGIFQALAEHTAEITKALAPLAIVFQVIGIILQSVFTVLWQIATIFIMIGQIIGKFIVIILGVIEMFGLVTLACNILAGALAIIAAIFLTIQGILEWVISIFEAFADILDLVIGAIYGKSPGLIPGLEDATGAMGDFNTEAGNMENVNVNLSKSIGLTTDQLGGITAPNMGTWGDGGSGAGGTVELGPMTQSFFRQLLGEEIVPDWSFPSETPAPGMDETSRRMATYWGAKYGRAKEKTVVGGP